MYDDFADERNEYICSKQPKLIQLYLTSCHEIIFHGMISQSARKPAELLPLAPETLALKKVLITQLFPPDVRVLHEINVGDEDLVEDVAHVRDLHQRPHPNRLA